MNRPRLHRAVTAALLAGAVCACAQDAPQANSGGVFAVDELVRSIAALPPPPPLRMYTARDGTPLGYRYYAGGSNVDVILLHGSAGHSRYLQPFAQALSEAGAANVYTPDLRGHGPSPARRGDIDYIGQFEDDLADLIAAVRADADSPRRLVLAGHSSGGGLALRFSGSRHGHLAHGYLLLAPYLGHDAPTVRPASGGWAMPRMGRIVTLALLNGFGIRRFNHWEVLHFNVSPQYRDGTETLSYTFRLMMGLAPRDYAAELRGLSAPLLLLVGADDEAFHAPLFEPTVTAQAPGARVNVIDGVGHMGLIASSTATSHAAAWLRDHATWR